MSCKIDSYVIANALGNCSSEIYSNLENSGNKISLTESDEYFSEKKVFVGKTNIDLSENEKQNYAIKQRSDLFCIWAYLIMRNRVDFLKKKFGKNRIGMILGTSTSGISNLESLICNKTKEKTESVKEYNRLENAFFTDRLKSCFGITGPSYTISTSCTSGLKAVSSAMKLLDCGVCDAVITGGIDMLCKLTLRGFDSLELLSKRVANPMSANRDGINIGEGIAICVLTKENGGIRIKAIGESCDTYHVSSPDPEGKGALKSMIMAMENANLSKDEIDYIQLHGTGTNLNDISEAKAIHNIWGDSIACSSIKPLIGHTLGISGIMGVLICSIILENKIGSIFLPEHAWDGCKDENIPQINLLNSNTPVKRAGPLNFLINNFAFGGNNCSAIIGKDDL